ncbi:MULTISPECIES: cytochrome c oxidase subunit 3 [Ramlibacter]|uniref:Heme-copper oxidase subunit III n=1 Tax=Ramlibacter aquaticus TaxID=2780094 RepID=A0ABR9SFB7_9BURK|nr:MULTISPECIES: cytochrome c oxidase subunit 3 [Ramlibacter]MBE7940904.1 heme-copper oxidase subunit III [Ramlibacter aquaticus]
MPDAAMDLTQALPVGSKGRLSSGWWGMWCVVATEAALFAYLLFSYFYIASQAPAPWPDGGPPPLGIAGTGTLVIVLASLTVWWGERGIMRGEAGRLRLGLAATLALGVFFIGLQLHEWRGKPFTLSKDAYGSLFFTITGFHMAHVIAGLLGLAVLLVWSLLGNFDRRRHAAISIGAVYWHFVTVVWLVVFASLYLSPYLGLAK